LKAMPTILEHLAALFDKDMRAVLNNPRAISMIANPSARVQMAAVRRDRRETDGKGTADSCQKRTAQHPFHHFAK